MKKITKKTRIEIKKDLGTELSDSEKIKLAFSRSLILNNVNNLNEVVIKIQFEKVELIPHTIDIYGFEEEPNEEKKPISFFKYLYNKPIFPYEINQPEILTINITEFCKRNFQSIEGVRVGFYIDKPKENYIIYYQVFEGSLEEVKAKVEALK